jgi:hypothetical protein
MPNAAADLEKRPTRNPLLIERPRSCGRAAVYPKRDPRRTSRDPAPKFRSETRSREGDDRTGALIENRLHRESTQRPLLEAHTVESGMARCPLPATPPERSGSRRHD